MSSNSLLRVAVKKRHTPTTDELFAVLCYREMTSIIIGKRTHQIGTLDEGARNRVTARGNRIVRHAETGEPLCVGDGDWTAMLQELLFAGDQGLDFSCIRGLITPAHILAAAHEVTRQLVVSALSGLRNSAR